MPPRKTHFNFRDVLRHLGYDLGNIRRNWAVGHKLKEWARKNRVVVARPLTEKTNPDSKVGAPHCIAAYPMDRFSEAVRFIQTDLDNPNQLSLL